MLVQGNVVKNELDNLNIKVTGALHIGAHECEELQFYMEDLSLTAYDVIWVEAMQHKVYENIGRGIPNQYQAVISDVDDADTNFYVANNGQSSSILEFGTHAVEHPHVYYIEQKKLKTKTIATLYDENNLDAKKYNFWNLDIQGAELLALKGSKHNIDYADAIYLEVNDKELYKNCALFTELNEFLQSKGFTCVLKKVTPHGWGDALYCRVKSS